MKEELLRLVGAGRGREAATLLAHVDDAEPEVAGQWTTKDVLAHLTAWREEGASELQAVRTGAPLRQISEDDDVENAKIYARTHPLPARAIVDAAARSWDGLGAALAELTEDEMHAARPRYADQEVWQILQSQTYLHLAGHLGSWLEERGDEVEAEKVAIWAHEMAFSAPVGDRGHGVAEYNLGCFYAKRGRAAEALPLLERGIRLRPDLKEWAKTDTDLDPIRTNEELVRLLG